MRRTLVPVALCFALLLAFAAISAAQTGANPPGKAVASPAGMAATAMKAPPEMDRIRWMVGTWQCSGKTMASAMGPEHSTEAQVVVEMALDDHWMLSHYREKKTAQNPMPISGDEAWAYDPPEKMWDRLAIDNTGGWATGTSKGWEKGKLVWMSDGMMGGQKMKFRDTFTEKNPREIGYLGEMGTPDGKWAAIWEVTCKK